MGQGYDNYERPYNDYYDRYRRHEREEQDRMNEIFQRMKALEKEVQYLQKELADTSGQNSFQKRELHNMQATIAMLELALFLATNSQEVSEKFKKQAADSIAMLKKFEQ